MDFNKDSAVLRCIGKDKQAVFVTSEVPSLNDGQSYNIEFGIIDVNESTVKVLLKINDKSMTPIRMVSLSSISLQTVYMAKCSADPGHQF